MIVRISATQRAALFGQPGQVKKESVLTPWGVPTLSHVLVKDVFLAACREAIQVSNWRPQRIDAYNPRPIRGFDGDKLSEWSLHSWCLAWDFFATPPGVSPPGGVWTPDNGVPAAFAECFERHGFRWGGRWTSRPDIPHIEWAGGLPGSVSVISPDQGDLMPADAQAILDKLQAVELRAIALEERLKKVEAKIVPTETVRADIRLTRAIASKVGVPT